MLEWGCMALKVNPPNDGKPPKITYFKDIKVGQIFVLVVDFGTPFIKLKKTRGMNISNNLEIYSFPDLELVIPICDIEITLEKDTRTVHGSIDDINYFHETW